MQFCKKDFLLNFPRCLDFRKSNSFHGNSLYFSLFLQVFIFCHHPRWNIPEKGYNSQIAALYIREFQKWRTISFANRIHIAWPFSRYETFARNGQSDRSSFSISRLFLPREKKPSLNEFRKECRSFSVDNSTLSISTRNSRKRNPLNAIRYWYVRFTASTL